MASMESVLDMVKLTEEQEKEGYWLEQSRSNVLVWHHQNQIAPLWSSPDVERKVWEVIERRKELKEVEERTGWKPSR